MPVPRLRLLATTGDSGVDRAIEHVISTTAPAFAECEVGYYLHGSAAARAMTSLSDIDLLALGNEVLSPNRREEASALMSGGAGHLDYRLDFKAFSWREFARDPWVDLDAAVHVYGKDWRPTIGRPSVDQRARESVLMVCASAAGLRNRTALPSPLAPIPAASMERPLHKYVGWLISALLAARHGHVPPSRQEALASLERFEPKRAAVLRGLHDTARESRAPANERAELALRIGELETEVIELLRDQARTRVGPLGPASWAVVHDYCEQETLVLGQLPAPRRPLPGPVG